MTLIPDSISTVEHHENAQEIYTAMTLKGKAIRFHVSQLAEVSHDEANFCLVLRDLC